MKYGSSAASRQHSSPENALSIPPSYQNPVLSPRREGQLVSRPSITLCERKKKETGNEDAVIIRKVAGAPTLTSIASWSYVAVVLHPFGPMVPFCDGLTMRSKYHSSTDSPHNEHAHAP